MSGAEVAGLTAGIVGSATGVAGLIVAVFGERRAGRAERAAAEATAGAASLEVSLERIADNFERDRHLREAELTARLEHLSHRPQMGARLTAGQLIHPPTSGPEFRMEFISGRAYRLRNVGVGSATSVTATVPNFPPGLTRGLPNGAEMPPMASIGPIVIIGAAEVPTPGEVLVDCDQLDEPVRVPLPPTG